VQVATHTSVVIVLSGRKCLALGGGLTLTDICQQSLTDCYDTSADPPAQGLSYIRGFNPNGGGAQPNPPLLRTVELIPSSACPNGAYFSNNTTGCVYDIYARVDKGNLANAAVIITANGAQLFSSNDPTCDTLNQTGVGTCWHAQLTLPPGSGPNNIKMTWEETSGCLDAPLCSDKAATVCKVGGGNKCKGDFENGVTVQRAYSARQADTGFNSGPIKVVKVYKCDGDPSCSQSDLQSFPVDSTHTFAVTIGVAGVLQNAANTSAPLVVLRVRSQANQALDCDPGYTNLKTELALGCRPTYVPNTGTPDCANLGTSALWATANPWSCIAVSTGHQPNQVAAGLNARLYQGNEQPASCAAVDSPGHNNWHMFNLADPTGNDGFPAGDPRILNAYITTYGAFSHVNGTSGSVPIVGFGHFYVTGYTGQGGGFDNPCYPGPPANYNNPANYPDDRVPNDDPGLIVGRFIYYVDAVGGDGTEPCDPASIFACVAVMTK
jgi:hypothetical protein